MIDQFSYLTVLLSIIMGLAMTQILKGFRGILLSRARVRLYWPSLVWAVLLLTICVEIWWSQFGMRKLDVWTLPAFYSVLLQFLLTYMLAAIVLPDFFDARGVDLREHYFSHIGWFFGLMIALLLSSLLKDFAVNGRIVDKYNLVFHGIFLFTSALPIVIRKDWFQKASAVFALVVFAMYTMLLFWKLD